MPTVLRKRPAVKSRRTKNANAPTARTPIPETVRPIIERAHARYLALVRDEDGRQPAVEDPAVVVPFFTLYEIHDLLGARYWPVPPEVLTTGRAQPDGVTPQESVHRLEQKAKDIERQLAQVRQELDQVPLALATALQLQEGE